MTYDHVTFGAFRILGFSPDVNVMFGDTAILPRVDSVTITITTEDFGGEVVSVFYGYSANGVDCPVIQECRDLTGSRRGSTHIGSECFPDNQREVAVVVRFLYVGVSLVGWEVV